MAEPLTIENRTFEEIQLGESVSLERTITREDIELYAAVSGDANPTHLDDAAARGAHFKGIVAHGMLSAGLFSNLLGNRLPGSGTVYISQDLHFAAPVHAGDTITVTVTATEKRADGNLVLFDCGCINQDGQEVLHGTATVRAPTAKIVREVAELPELTLRRHDKLAAVIERTREIPAIPTAVAFPCDESSLNGALEAAEEGMIVPILVGPRALIEAAAGRLGRELGAVEIVDAADSHDAAARAVALVRDGRAELLMKGSLHSDEILAAVIARDTGLRTRRRVSHVFVMDVPTYDDLLFVTDAAVNVEPDLKTLVDIVQNAIDLHVGLGLGAPRVAILAAVETVNPDMLTTIEAAALCKMADRGQITGGVLDGPLAMDNAISLEAARIKGIVSEVAGRAQILVVPDLESGNMLAKNLSFLAGAEAAGIVLGARVPVILTSRADSVRARKASCALASLFVHHRRQAAMLATA